MEAKKSLGQNFLVNDQIIKKIVSLINCNNNDLIIEIGPGRGALSKEISKLNSNYLAIEIDTDMKQYLDSLNIDVIYDDILKVDLPNLLNNYKYDRLFIIGNLPYYITSPILEKLIDSKIDIYKMIFMVQKEVADRYSAKPGNKDFGYMSLYLQFDYLVKKEFDVTKGNFRPIPKVDSSIITLVNNKKNIDIDFSKYNNFLKEAFSMKRKTLKNNLRNYNWETIKTILLKNGLSESVRAEELSQDIFLDIYKSIKE